MSKFTTQVRSICEYYANIKESPSYIGVDEVLEKYNFLDKKSVTKYNKYIL